MHKIAAYLLLFVLVSCKIQVNTKVVINESNTSISRLLNQWHRDVAEFNYDDYFNKMTEDAIFVGTDASEVWSKQAFQSFSKPYFDKKQTWNFKPISRNVYLDKTEKTAWFDELLDTWMGVCRGSGVLIKIDKQWKIQHYVLSVAVPNDDMKAVINIKKKSDSLFIVKQRTETFKKG